MEKGLIVVVEDEEDILELITFNLKKEGFHVRGETNGRAGLDAIRRHRPRLVLLDLMLPDMDGLQICREIKADKMLAGIPVIMVTARGEETDIVVGLEMGADDYVPKPFSPRVLLARVKAVLRRRHPGTDKDNRVWQSGDLVIDPVRHLVTLDGQPVPLSATEFRILLFLMQRPGWVFTRDQIIDAVHGRDYPVTERSIDVQVATLRKKLGLAGRMIETVRGVGYRMQDKQ